MSTTFLRTASALLLATALALTTTAHAQNAEPKKVLRGRLSRRRNRLSTRQRSTTSIRSPSRPHLRGAVQLRPSGAAGQDQAAPCRRHARGLGDFRPGRSRCAPASTSRRPGVQGQEARSRRAGLRLRLSAHRRPGQQEPELGRDRCVGRHLGLAEVRKAALDGKKPFDYDAPIEGMRALDRYTVQFKLSSRGRASPSCSQHRTVRRAGARGRRVLWRADRRAPGGHRAVPAEAVAAQFADRAGEEPRLPRRAL